MASSLTRRPQTPSAYTLKQTGLCWAPIPICEYFQVALRVCQGLGCPWMPLAGFRKSLNATLRDLARALRESGKRFCSHASTHPTPTQPNRTTLDWRLPDLQSVFLLPEKVQNSTLHTLQTELWTESAPLWINGGRGGASKSWIPSKELRCSLLPTRCQITFFAWVCAALWHTCFGLTESLWSFWYF